MGQEIHLAQGGEKVGFTQNSHFKVGGFFSLVLHPLIFGEGGGGREKKLEGCCGLVQ